MSQSTMQLTILTPCLNEAETLGMCITKATRSGVRGEIVIADNDSMDDSQEIAQKAGGLIHIAERGYRSPLNIGIETARGKFVIMGDADNSYDFSAQFAIWGWVE